MMKVICPHCGREIPFADVNMQTSTARCQDCFEAFSFAAPDGTMAPPPPPPLAQVKMPRGCTVEHQASDLVLTRRWMHWRYIGLVFFCIFWDGFLIFWYATGIRFHGPLPVFLFPLLHVAAGVYLTYSTLAGLLNRTEIRVNSLYLSVRHFPLPWPGNKMIPSADIDQLFCEEKWYRGRYGPYVRYNVNAIHQQGGQLTLVKGLESADHARFIEQQVEAFLGITNQPVAGEI